MRYSIKTISEAYFSRFNPSDVGVLTHEINAMNTAYLAIHASSARKHFVNPTISAESRKSFMENLFSLFSFAPATKELFVILAQDRKIKLIPKIFNELKKIREKRFGVIEIDVTVPTPLKASQKKEIEALFEKISNGKKSLISEHIDTNILGGFILRAGGTLLDASFSRKIKTIQKIIIS